MAYKAIEVASDKTAARTRWIRDWDGAIHLVYRDSSMSGVRYLYSTDDGRTFVARASHTGVGNNFFTLMLDDDGRLFLGSHDGTTSPQIWLYNEDTSTWDLVLQFTNLTGLTNNFFALDASAKYETYGYGLFITGFSATKPPETVTNARYLDSEHPNGNSGYGYQIAADATNPQYTPMPVTTAAGRCYIAYLTTLSGVGQIRIVERLTNPIPGTPTFSAATQISAPGHNVTHLEDVTIQTQTELPTVLYRRNNGGTYELWIAELGVDGNWTQTLVSDGTNNETHPTGGVAFVQYDRRGSVYVSAVNTVPGSGGTGQAEPYCWFIARALGGTTWLYIRISGGTSGGNTWPGALMSNRSVEKNGVYASQFYQGCFGYFWAWPAGMSSSQQILYYVNFDEYPGGNAQHANGVYPTKLEPIEGEPQYRTGDELLASRASWVLDGEGTATLEYPGVLDHVRPVDTTYEKNVHPYCLGYVGGRPKYVSARRVLVGQQTTDETTMDTAVAFLKARRDDLAPFTVKVKLDQGVTELDVHPDQESLEVAPKKLDADVWFIEFKMVESV